MGHLKTLRALFLVEHLNVERASEVEGATWEPFQLEHLNDDGTFRIESKSRQIAWSWLSAAESVADALLDATSSIFVSYNQDEAKEKIRYARRVFECLEGIKLEPLKRDNELSLEFENGARLLSLPARPPRGKSRANVYLDEFAHVRDDRAIYTAALPIISKGGRLRIGSSPLGASGVFWEIMGQSLRQYPGFVRRQTPWWKVRAFCRDVPNAGKFAGGMSTAERVDAFGTDRIKSIHANMLLEDFQQEYECTVVDESTAWITWDEIRSVQDAELVHVAARCSAGDTEAAIAAVDALAQLCGQGRIEPALAGGMDIGRTRNASELFFVGLATTGHVPLRGMLTLEAMPFDEQFEVAAYAMSRLPVSALFVDQNGIGRNIAENLEMSYPGKAQGVDFTGPSKTVWATDAKMLVQQRRAAIPTDRDLAYQIHSIKKTVTASKNLVFDTARNEKHHADKFWAWALAFAAGNFVPEQESIVEFAEHFEISPV